MKIHFLQHAVFEGPAAILDWAKARHAHISVTQFDGRTFVLPKMVDFDMLVIMGGPMGVHDEKKYPWLAQEKRFIADALAFRKKIVGVCLGSQLCAHVLGARVYTNTEKEIGWFPIYKTRPSHPVFDHMPDEIRVFSWHGDAFDLPAGAVHLASSAICENQAYLWNEQVLGLQYHMEALPQDIELFIEHAGHETELEGRYIQSREQIRAGYPLVEPLLPLLHTMLDRFSELPPP